jgi:hypothetical protein
MWWTYTRGGLIFGGLYSANAHSAFDLLASEAALSLRQ